MIGIIDYGLGNIKAFLNVYNRLSISAKVIKVEKYAFIYNGKLEGKSTEMTTLKEALGEGFDFTELMNS